MQQLASSRCLWASRTTDESVLTRRPSCKSLVASSSLMSGLCLSLNSGLANCCPNPVREGHHNQLTAVQRASHRNSGRHATAGWSGELPVAMCSSEKWTPSMLIMPRNGLSSWRPATTTEFHRGSILHHEALTSGSVAGHSAVVLSLPA